MEKEIREDQMHKHEETVDNNKIDEGSLDNIIVGAQPAKKRQDIEDSLAEFPKMSD